ncbi:MULTISPECIES: helix-turn-helix transcriptional regulator [Gordonia]|nr:MULTISPECIES: helix-turn-helix transcriptional regulator [Gordonia]
MADDDLGAFLRARRTAAAPQDYALPTHTTRRVPGLRREEVAEMAGMSTDYYTRLEQGREQHPSEQVVTALTRALRLTGHQGNHLRLLAGLAPLPVSTTTHLDQALTRMMDSWDDSAAFILDPLLNMTRLNPLAEALFSSFRDNRNYARNVFLDPAGRRFFADWDRSAQSSVASLRATMHQHPSPQERAALIEELRTDDEFDRLWEQYDVAPKTAEVKTLRHERVGDITVSFHAFAVMSAPGRQLIVYQPEPGSVSESRLLTLRIGALHPRPTGVGAASD